MAYEYTPHVGYGPLKFGMSPEDVHAILGAPETTSSVMEFLDPEFIDAEDLPFLEGHFGEDFPNGLTDNTKPSVSYDPSGLVTIMLRNTKEPFDYQGIDLFGKDRKAVMHALAEQEDQLFAGDEDYFFPKAGLLLTRPDAWKRLGSLTFVKVDYIMARLDYDDWEELDELDF